MISPVLFCFYVDKLLFNIEAICIGFFIGNMFVGALAYAGDIVLIPPTSRAMRPMLFTWYSFADNFSIVCNVKKSRLYLNLLLRPLVL